MEDLTKTIMFTTNAIQNSTPTTIQYQATTDPNLKQPKIEGQKTTQQQEFPTFCYTNVNMIQKLTPTTQAHASTVNLAQLSDDNKACYIAQPFGYNYALVNQFAQNGITGITVDGRQLVVNKPITNTVSNISFKCDVCGVMFAHLTHLNQHKRVHNQDGTDNNSDSITVVAQTPNLVQAQNLVAQSELGQIQIVATEALEPATSQAIQHVNVSSAGEVTIAKPITVQDKGQKCITCGGNIQQNPKRKGPKLIRCENCISNDNPAHIVPRPTQIFVAPDGDVKFEMTDISTSQAETIESLGGQTGIPVATTSSVQNQQHIQQHQHQQQSPQKHAVGHHPVKKRNTAAVTKCHKCNGSGLIYIGGQKRQQQQENEKPFHCNICGGTFSRYSSLWSHRKLHSGEKNYKCTVCGLAFAKAVYLKNHSRIHTGEKPYRCNTCGMQFSQSPHLKNHERTHSGEKPYVCEVCDKGFARHATLWNHRRIHTGEKPYKCDICGSAFSQAAHLKNHAKVHSGEKPFKCDICSAAFADRFALKRHRNIHEKYGQTAPRNSGQNSGQNLQPIQKEELPEMDDDDGKIHNEVIISGL